MEIANFVRLNKAKDVYNWLIIYNKKGALYPRVLGPGRGSKLPTLNNILSLVYVVTEGLKERQSGQYVAKGEPTPYVEPQSYALALLLCP